MPMRIALPAFAFLLHTCAALAADLPVHYLLDERAIRKVDAASPATIALFTDARCAIGVFTTTLPLRDVDALVRVPATPLRGIPKPPKTAELRHTLHGVPAVAPLYARVTGNGITPIGIECQVQSIPAPPANTPVLIDGTGTVLGPYGVSTDYVGRPVWIRSSGDLTYTVSVDPTELYGSAWDLYFEAPDCSSPPLIYAQDYEIELFYGSVSHGSTLYYPLGAPSQRTVTAKSYWAATSANCGSDGIFAPPDHCCVPIVPGPSYTNEFIATATTDLGQFTPPFHAELR